MEWIKRASDYRTLVGKRDQLGFPLGAVEAARLVELERFFQTRSAPCQGGAAARLEGERALFAQRDHERAPLSVVVTFAGGAGKAVDISSDGLFIETEAPLPVGAHTVVRLEDRGHGQEFRFGAEVVRIQTGAHRGMGLRFVGIPLMMRVGHSPPPPRESRRPQTPPRGQHTPPHGQHTPPRGQHTPPRRRAA